MISDAKQSHGDFGLSFSFPCAGLVRGEEQGTGIQTAIFNSVDQADAVWLLGQ